MEFSLVIFLPCVLGLFSYFIFTKEKNWFELLLIYLVNVLLTNLVSMGVLYLKNDEIYSLITRFEVDYRFAFKYMILATVIGLVIGVVSAIIKKYLVFNIEVENGRKK